MRRNYTQRQVEILTLLAKYGVLGAANSFLCVGTTENKLFDVNAKPIYCADSVLPLGTWLSLFRLSEAHKRYKVFLELSVPATGKLSTNERCAKDKK